MGPFSIRKEKDMKTHILTVVVLLVLVVGSAAAEKPVKKTLYIKGYLNDQFAIVGLVRDSFDEVVGIIKKDQPPSTELHIVTWGSADKTGKFAENEPLSGRRSEEACKRLLIVFPGAKRENVIACALGDYENIKQVKVDYWFTPTPAIVTGTSSPQKAEGDNNIIWWILAVTAGLVVIAVVILVLRKRKKVPAILRRVDPVEVSWEGRSVSVPLVLRVGGNVWTNPPLWNPDNKGWIYRENRQLEKKAVVSFFKDAVGDERRLSQIREFIGAQNS